MRRGWDAHVRYGLENPSFYVLLHGRIKVGVPCGVTGPALAAVTLQTALADDSTGLTPGETALLAELLDRIASETP